MLLPTYLFGRSLKLAGEQGKGVRVGQKLEDGL